jgi:hypothetical protein
MEGIFVEAEMVKPRSSGTAFEVEGAKFVSPGYMAVMLSLPNCKVVVSVATPFVTVPCPRLTLLL